MALPTESYPKYTGSAGQRSCSGCFSTRHSIFFIQKTNKRYEYSQRLSSLHASVIPGHEGKRLCQGRLYVRKSNSRYARSPIALRGLRLTALGYLRPLRSNRKRNVAGLYLRTYLCSREHAWDHVSLRLNTSKFQEGSVSLSPFDISESVSNPHDSTPRSISRVGGLCSSRLSVYMYHVSYKSNQIKSKFILHNARTKQARIALNISIPFKKVNQFCIFQ